VNRLLSEVLSWSATDLKQRQQVQSMFRPMLDALHSRAALADTEAERCVLINGYLKIANDCSKSIIADFSYEAMASALRLNPESLALRTKLMRLLEANNQMAAAKELQARISDELSDVDDPSTVICLSRIHTREKQYIEAIKLIEPALTWQLSDQHKAKLWFQYANNLHQLGKYKEAFNSYKRANNYVSNSSELSCYASDALVILSRIKKLTLWYKAGNRFPSPPVVDDELPIPIFLLGFPRSGTTLLEQILDAHPSLSTISERPLLAPLFRPFCGHPEQVSSMLSKLKDREVMALRAEYWRRLRFFHGTPLNGNGVVDKLPLNMNYLALIRFFFPEAKIIMALREPRDVVLSNFMQHFRPNKTMWHSFKLDRLVTFYQAVMVLYQENRELYQQDILEVRYESVLKDLRETSYIMAKFLEISDYGAIPNYAETAKNKRIHTPSYHQVIQPLYGHAVDRWRLYAPYMDQYFSQLDECRSLLGYI
jgi:tetratricopeptide (TPR) repeat protein